MGLYGGSSVKTAESSKKKIGGVLAEVQNGGKYEKFSRHFMKNEMLNEQEELSKISHISHMRLFSKNVDRLEKYSDFKTPTTQKFYFSHYFIREIKPSKLFHLKHLIDRMRQIAATFQFQTDGH